jgi:hypothetical protein
LLSNQTLHKFKNELPSQNLQALDVHAQDITSAVNIVIRVQNPEQAYEPLHLYDLVAWCVTESSVCFRSSSSKRPRELPHMFTRYIEALENCFWCGRGPWTVWPPPMNIIPSLYWIPLPVTISNFITPDLSRSKTYHPRHGPQMQRELVRRTYQKVLEWQEAPGWRCAWRLPMDSAVVRPGVERGGQWRCLVRIQ